MVSPALTSRRLLAVGLAFGLIATACGSDDASPVISGVEVTTPEDLSEPEAISEAVTVGTTKLPPMMVVTFHNRTDVDIDFTFQARTEVDGVPKNDDTRVALANGNKVAALIVNPVESFSYGFEIGHKDWLGLNNVYSFYPGFGAAPQLGCDQKLPDFNKGDTLNQRSWKIELTDNSQGYRGKMTNGTFVCFFHMYTAFQSTIRRNALAAVWDAVGLYYDYVFMVPVSAVVGQVSEWTGWEAGESWAKGVLDDLFDVEIINSKILDIGYSLTAEKYKEKYGEFLTSKQSVYEPAGTRKIRSGVLLQVMPGDVDTDRYVDQVTEGIDDDGGPVDIDVIEARSQLALMGE